MRAAVLDEVGADLVVDDVDLAAPRPGEVSVEVAACGACHSDLSVADGSFPQPVPIVLGHEAAGVVADVGPGVTSVSPGDHVMLTPVPPCGRCYFCLRGDFTICVNVAGLYSGAMPDGVSPLSRRGQTVYRGLAAAAWAERAVMPEAGVVKIDDDVPLDVACVIGCAVQTGVGAVLNTAKVEEGATVAVFGAGGIGIAITQGARIAGASRIIVSDPVAERREAALRFGATDVVDPAAESVRGVTGELTKGIGVDYAFEGSGLSALLPEAIDVIRPGGTAVMVGAPPITDSLTIPAVVAFGASEKKLLGCLMGSCNSHRDVPKLLDLHRAGRLDLDGMITSRVPLDDVNVAVDNLRAARGIRTVVTMT